MSSPGRVIEKKSDSSNKKKQELIKQAISYRMVYSLNAGGRKQKMSVFVAVGNGMGKAGYGIGKTKDTSSAVARAVVKASKNMVRIPLKQRRTVYNHITCKYCSTIVRVMSVPEGSGMKCSNTARLYLECLGIKDISVKFYRSTNPINSVKALAKALTNIVPPKEIAARRGVSLFRVVSGSKYRPDMLDKGNNVKSQISDKVVAENHVSENIVQEVA